MSEECFEKPTYEVKAVLAGVSVEVRPTVLVWSFSGAVTLSHSKLTL